jgi:hypothetical protein
MENKEEFKRKWILDFRDKGKLRFTNIFVLAKIFAKILTKILVWLTCQADLPRLTCPGCPVRVALTQMSYAN